MKAIDTTHRTSTVLAEETNRSFLRRATALAVCLLAFSNVSSAVSENEFICGELDNAYGPFDYRVAPDYNKRLVERAHFTREVEHLVRPKTGPFGHDIDYTLRAFPNHPRALKSMMELGLRTKARKPEGAKWPVWCYFDRAIRFRPDDGQVRMVFSIYLYRTGKYKEAVDQLYQAEKLLPESANLHYNMGTILLDLGEFEKSLVHAHKAYALGFQLPGLRNRLKAANKWREPLPENEPAEQKQP